MEDVATDSEMGTGFSYVVISESYFREVKMSELPMLFWSDLRVLRRPTIRQQMTPKSIEPLSR